MEYGDDIFYWIILVVFGPFALWDFIKYMMTPDRGGPDDAVGGNDNIKPREPHDIL